MRRMLVLAAAALAAISIVRRRQIDDEDLWTEATKAPDLR
ncbi:MAG TPA: DLW-39 family protein [Frankiaceae bacterium]|nr:DLW-39 family protein [Frankiaceae bacterium]